MINRFYYWKILIQLFSVVHVRKELYQSPIFVLQVFQPCHWRTPEQQNQRQKMCTTAFASIPHYIFKAMVSPTFLLQKQIRC